MKFNRANCGMKKCSCGMTVLGGPKGWKTHHGRGGSHRKRMLVSGLKVRGVTLRGRKPRRGKKSGKKSRGRKQ